MYRHQKYTCIVSHMERHICCRHNCCRKDTQTIIFLMQDKPTGESSVHACSRVSGIVAVPTGPSVSRLPFVWASQRMRENAYTKQRTMAGLGLVASRLMAQVNLARSLASAYARTCIRCNGAQVSYSFIKHNPRGAGDR